MNKQIFRGILAVAVIIGIAALFAGCNDDSGGGGDNSSLGEIAEIKGVKPDIGDLTPNTEYDFGNYMEDGYAVKINADGSLSFKLTEPKAENLYTALESLTDMDSVTVDPKDIKIFDLHFFSLQNSSKVLVWKSDDGNKSVRFYYANKDGTIKAERTTKDSIKVTINMSLKKGWNTILYSWDETTSTTKSGTPDSSYKWKVIDDK